MKKHYQEPNMKIKSCVWNDVILASPGDGTADDPFTQGNPFMQG